MATKTTKQTTKRGPKKPAQSPKRQTRKKSKFWKFFTDNTSTLLVILSFVLCAAYTITSIIIQYKTCMELSATLTENVFQFFGFELISLATIKVSKNIKEAVIGKSKNTKTDDANTIINEDAVG